MYTPTIGLEVHAELKTKSKMFCGCANDPHSSEPNRNICPVCLAHPGTLPVANFEAVKFVLQFGLAVGGELATYTEFDRKNYFYPDIPKAYQISQYQFPFIKGGSLNEIPLTRVHLEEDTARSQHDKGTNSLVDFNRAGVPLMELVTEPVIHDAVTAGKFAKELQLLLRTIGLSDANMEKGEMRVEANISVSKSGEMSKKYVEVKNLNSFRSVESAIDFEIERQIKLLENGEELKQETRGWDEIKQQTFSQRSKETAKDYRYFPDPDLPKLDIEKIEAFKKECLADTMPELPSEKRSKYNDIELPSKQIEIILQTELISRYFDKLIEIDNNKIILLSCANYLLTDFLPLLQNSTTTDDVLTPQNFFSLIDLTVQKKISSRVTKDIIANIGLKNEDPISYIDKNQLTSNFNDDDLNALINKILLVNPKVVDEYKSGKVAVLQYLLGQAMKETKGAVNPETLKSAFISSLV